MHTELITPALAAVYLMAMPPFIDTRNFRSTLIFKVAPAFIGVALAFQTYGRYFGWPV